MPRPLSRGDGSSGRSPTESYRFVDHARYLDAWFDGLGLTRNVTLVVHDWGSALGFYRASRYPDQLSHRLHGADCAAAPMVRLRRGGRHVQGAALTGGRAADPRRERLRREVLPGGVLRRLDEAELDRYRAPFQERSARLPTLVWPREIPIEGEPADVRAIVEAYGQWIAQSALPKLLVLGEPGALGTGRTREFCRTWRNQLRSRSPADTSSRRTLSAR